MKKFTVIILLLFVVSTAKGQIEKGKVQVSGSFSYLHNESGGNETTIFNLVPQAGFFISDKTSLGVILGYQSFRNQSFNPSNASDKTFYYGVFSRFYKPIVDRFYFFAQPQIALGSGETSAGEDISTFSIGIRPGFSYFFSDKLSMDLSAQGFMYDKSEEGNFEGSTTSFSLNPGTVNVGVSFMFWAIFTPIKEGISG